MTVVGAWDRWYAGLEEPAPYGDDATYRAGAAWFAECSLVEDWGCGKGWMRRFVAGDYRGIDGSATPFADVIVDLTTYRSTAPGVFVRHVLEHNYEWATILDNAVASAQERLCVVLFTPLVEQTHEIAFADDPGVPDIAFALEDITNRIDVRFTCEVETIATATQYGTETIIRGRR